MSSQKSDFVLHPWHGISPGDKVPDSVDAFIEMLPTDTVKYEVDKDSGYIRLDRPQKYSNHCPSLYGFIPQTYCGDKVAKICMDKTGKENIEGDGDPLDICVLTSSVITHGNILMRVIPIGGMRMIDKGEADDKIIAILKGDSIFGHMQDIHHCPADLINKLKHYFLTYKAMPDESEPPTVEITGVYGAQEAKQIILTSLQDYKDKFSA
jgi:inorganic pyrophosphatase